MQKKFLYILLLAVVSAGYFFLTEKQKFLFQRNPPKTQLWILTYSSFVGIYGPGRIIEKKFESFCNCDIRWFLTEDSTTLLQRFSLIPSIDVVIGWDQLTLPHSQEHWEDLSFLKEDLIFSKESYFPSEDFFQNSYFVPLNWSPVGFLHKGLNSPPTRLKSLYEIEKKMSFPEPGSSTLGLQLYYWIYEVFKGKKEDMISFFKSLKDKIYGPVFSWSLAYGFFKKGQTDMSLSYLSSLIYHHNRENRFEYAFLDFQEGHPYQMEFFSVSRSSKRKNTGMQFARFLLSKEIQTLMLKNHYMFPVTHEFPRHFLLERKIKFISYKRSQEFIKNKKELLKLWEKELH